MRDWQAASSIPTLFDELPPDLESEAVADTPPPLPTADTNPPTLPVDNPRVAPTTAPPDALDMQPVKAGSHNHGVVKSTGKILVALGMLACLMILFPPIQTYKAPVVFDPGYAGGGRNPNYADVNPMGYGQPDVLIDAGGYRNTRFGFLLTLGEADRIVFSQLAAQLVGVLLVGFAIVVWRNNNPKQISG